MRRRLQPLRIAIDTGGTFTDCVWMEAGRLRMLKVFSTPEDPSRAILEALRTMAPGTDFVMLHGTTVGTNTLLEGKGARTALVTTRGFEDAIEIGRQARPKLYDLFFERAAAVVPRELRFGIDERTGADGEILSAPSPDDLQSLVTRVSATKPQAIAISLLFCFANAKNEQSVSSALEAVSVPLSTSHQILPEFREYERTSTVVINAYLQPVMRGYLENLDACASNVGVEGDASKQKPRLRLSAAGSVPKTRGTVLPKAETQKPGAGPRIFVMQSSGGIASISAAAREPVRTVLSGPAGGVVGAVASARASGFENIIAFDMGGTSTDVSLAEGEIKTANDAQIAGLPVGVPMLDIHTVGAGGGSLARFDAAGVLRVGPESAGADPGPISYGRGTQPTVTDANLLLGRLQPARFLGGNFTLDLERTRKLTQAWLKKQSSNLTVEKFAAGVIQVVNATMEKAIRVVSIERGRDPRHFALIAFGGAGGLHACALAEALHIPHVIVPAFPGALSALGILASDVVKHYSRTILWRVSGKIPHAQLAREFSTLQKNAVKDFRQEAWQGKPQFERSVDVRYRGQGYELNVPFSADLLRDFEREHKRRYGYTYANREIELVTVRLRAVLKSDTEVLGPDVFVRSSTRVARKRPGDARVFFDDKNLRTTLLPREELEPGKKYRGPAIVTEYSATTVVPPGLRFHVDKAANLIVSK